MKLTTSFFGDDLLFEGDVALTLRALPAGARVTRAVATLAPVASSRAGSQPFVEEFAVAGGGGPFGLLVEAEPAPPAAVVDLGARRTVQRLGVTGLASGSAGGAFLQLDMGGVWVMLDNQGSPTTTVTPARRRFVVTDPPSPNPQNLPPALALPGLQGQRLRLTHAGASTAAIAVQRVTLRSYPSNVTLRLGDLGPVWFKVGDLREAAVTPDFAAILDAFTQRVAPEGGVYEVPFTLHSDTLARLRVTLEIEFFLSQPLLPPPLTQAVFSFGYSATPEGAPAPLRAVLPLNARAIPGATAAQVSGRFGASRVVHGPVRATSYADTVTVAGGQTVAHPIRLAAPATVDAIDLHVEAVTSEAALLVTLQEDVSGKPWGASLFAEPVRVELARPPAGGARWASAPLAAPFTFQPDTVYWLVVTAAEGEARWAVAPAGTLPPLQRTTDGGLSYRAVRSETLGGAVAGIYRLRTTPAQFRQPLKLDVAGHEVSLARFDALGKVDFLLDLPEVAQAVDAALQDAAAAQGLLAERVANGDFTRWTRFERRSRRAATPPLALEMELSAEAVPAAALAVSPEGGLAAVIGAVTDAAGASGGVVQAVVNTAPLRQGDRLPLAGTPGGGQLAPHALAYAPHGDAIYVLVQQRDDSAGGLPAVQRYAARGGAPLATRPIDGAFDPRALLLAADPACRFVYAAVRRAADDNERFPVEITRLPSDLGPGKQMQTLEVADDASSLRAFLVAPDGRRAYLAVGGRIAVVDLERWQALGAAWGPTAGAMSSGSSFSSAAGRLGGRLVGLALSPDGARLYAVQETMRPGNDRRLAREVVVIDAARLEQAAAGAASFAQAVLAVAPLNVTEGGSGERWLPAAATPDDARLLVAAETLRTRPGSEFAQETWDLYLVDTASHQVRETVGLPREPVAVAVTPDSRRALVLTVQDPPAFGPEVRAVELDGWSVDEWALTAGRAAPVCAPGAAKPSLRLGSPEGDTGLSQIVAVQGGQVYELRFQGRASGPEAAAEIFWLDGQCGRLGQATIPIDHRCAAGLWPHRLRAAAPAGADRAELRLRQPFGGFAIVDDVSLATPAAATANGDFAARTPATRPDNPDEPLLDAEGELVLVPAGWTLAPADLPASVLVQYQPDGTLRLTPPDARPATLSQELQVAPGRPVVLELEAHPYGPVGGEPATVELRWSGSTTAPLRVEVDPQQFDVVVVRGDAPADVTGAELAIVQPPGGALALRRIQVSQPASAEIPLTFLAEAPGDLAVADPVVVYDLGEAPQAPVDTPPGPSVPLGCAPTPPEDVPLPPGGPPKPGEDLLAEPDAGYCPCCERHHAPDDPAATTSESGMRGVAGRCPHGEARVVIYPARGHGGG